MLIYQYWQVMCQIKKRQQGTRRGYCFAGSSKQSDLKSDLYPYAGPPPGHTAHVRIEIPSSRHSTRLIPQIHTWAAQIAQMKNLGCRKDPGRRGTRPGVCKSQPGPGARARRALSVPGPSDRVGAYIYMHRGLPAEALGSRIDRTQIDISAISAISAIWAISAI